MKTKQHVKHSFCRRISGLLLVLLMTVTAAIPVPSQAAAGENSALAAAVVPGKTRITSARAASATAVFLDWEKAENATSYYVYYKLSGAKSWTKIACVRDLGYAHISKSLKEGKRYLYTVRAYNAKSKRLGGYSNVVAVVPKNVQPTSVKFNKASMVLSNKSDRTPSDKNLLGVTILPKNATTNLVKITVSNPKIVSLQYTEPGVFVLARRKGTTTITATCPNGKKAVCRVTVK